MSWLETVLLKQDLIHVCIITFSYNLSVQSSKSISNISVFADQLFKHLIRKCKKRE